MSEPADGAPLAPGTTVRVATMMPPGHVRTPVYLRGRRGVVERRLGPFPLPEELAYHRPGRPHDLYRVRFTMAEIWGAAAERPRDTLEAEIYAHWLRPEPTDAA
ncbi:SH3-like domain-containing protein [Profundibacterium mesophilum]|uniref:Nitrile hydratase n=1 Tax=Profundibacterium mesophilum KAUST100406-0324 TaxID=1037889 RepID=A0A921TDX5_9RHOB|nr:SH3-like domain-containing protein [Profundibacterium mesophilum]KAF0674804.1 nitrile hydratase [Profundibacterium mesophilum KAUST100406-0324]